MIASSWTNPAESERNRRWTRRIFNAIAEHVPPAVYMNDMDQDYGDERVRQAYGENYPRLVAIKRTYRYPTNFFRANRNISQRLTPRRRGRNAA